MLSPIKLAPAGILLASLMLSAPAAHGQAATAGPFGALAGSWTGGGNMSFSDGRQESLRCRAVYQPSGAGDNLRLNLKCASAGGNFDLASDVAYRGGAISGSWSEASRNANGTLTGRASGNTIEASARGENFAANLALTTQGNRQSVSIRSQGGDIAGVTLALSRSEGRTVGLSR